MDLNDIIFSQFESFMRFNMGIREIYHIYYKLFNKNKICI